MRQLVANQQAVLACSLRHVATGVTVILPAFVTVNGTALACNASGTQPLLEGQHNVLLSFNGVDFHGASAANGTQSSPSASNATSYTTYTAHGPTVSLATRTLFGNSTSGSDIAVVVTMNGTSTAPVAVTLSFTGGGGGYTPVRLFLLRFYIHGLFGTHTSPSPARCVQAVAAPQLNQLALYDYTLVNTSGPTLTWPPGSSGPQTLVLRVPSTTEQRPTTSLTISFTAASVTGGDPDAAGNSSAVLVIANSNPAPAFGVPRPGAAYARETGIIAVAPVVGSSALETQVSYVLTNGSATAGVHFAPAAGTLVWPPRDVTPKNIPVTVLWDAIPAISALWMGVSLSGDGVHGSVYMPSTGNSTTSSNRLVVPLDGSGPVLSLFGVPRATCPPGTAIAPRRPPSPSPPPAVFVPPAPPPPGHPASPQAPPAPMLAYPVAPANTSGCVYCQPGSFAAVANASVCALCAPGTFTPLTRALTCTRCAPGLFSSAPGAVACHPCGTGTASMADNSGCALCNGNATTVLPGQATCSVPVTPFVLQNDTRASLVRFTIAVTPSAGVPSRNWPANAGALSAAPCTILAAYLTADLAVAFSVSPGAVSIDYGATGCAQLASSNASVTGHRRSALQVQAVPATITVAVVALLPRDADAAGIAAAVEDAKQRAAGGVRAVTSSLDATVSATEVALGVSFLLAQAPNTTVVAPPVAPASISPWAKLPLHLPPAALIAASCAAAIALALAVYAAARCACGILSARRSVLASRRLADAEQKMSEDGGGGTDAITRIVQRIYGSGVLSQRIAEDYPRDIDGLRVTISRPDAAQAVASYVRDVHLHETIYRSEWASRAQRNAMHGRAAALYSFRR